MNEETKKAIDESIEHWKRMIAWAEKQAPFEYIIAGKMRKEIKEVWSAESCGLCKLFYDFERVLSSIYTCANCPLNLKGYKCETKGSPWAKVNGSSVWFEWTKNAKEFLKILEGLKDEKL